MTRYGITLQFQPPKGAVKGSHQRGAVRAGGRVYRQAGCAQDGWQCIGPLTILAPALRLR